MTPHDPAPVGAIAADWIEVFGGAEKVLDRMVACFPDADLLTLWNDADRYPGKAVRESWLARTPLRRRKALALPFMSSTWRSFDASSYERVLVSSHAYAHHFASSRRARGVERFVYVHSPARWLWARELDARGDTAAARAALPVLQRQDRRAVSDGSSYAANSHFVAERIQRVWGVDSHVVYPPVDTAGLRAVADWSARLDEADRLVLDSLPSEFVLGASRFVQYKRLDLVIEYGEAVDTPVVIAGSGPLADSLAERAARASVPVTMVPAPSDALLRALFQRALVYVYPPVEDFGIMPVESYALGTPAIVNRIGGASEAARLAGGGVAVDFTSPREWQAAFHQALELDPSFVSTTAEVFSDDAFDANLRAWLATPSG
jgi:glycosyltransferase involved in cell wall biosynthesis